MSNFELAFENYWSVDMFSRGGLQFGDVSFIASLIVLLIDSLFYVTMCT